MSVAPGTTPDLQGGRQAPRQHEHKGELVPAPGQGVDAVGEELDAVAVEREGLLRRRQSSLPLEKTTTIEFKTEWQSQQPKSLLY